MGGLLGGTSYGNGSRTTTTNIGPVPTTVPAGANMEGIYDLFRRMTQARSPERVSSTPLLGGVSRMPARGNPLNRATESYDPLRSMARENAAQQLAQPYGPTPSQFGRWMMNHTGNWGTFVDPADIPASLQGTIMGGMYGQGTNWDTSNPSIMGPQQLSTGKYTKNASGAGSGGSMASIGYGGQGYDPNAPKDDRRPDWYGLETK